MPATATAAPKSKDATAFATMKPPEELRAASEKLMNFWVGAATPLWFPFMAATSFGIGTWALTQAMQRQQELLKDMPLGGGLGGGLSSFWLAGERASEALAVTEVRLAKEVETAPETLKAAVAAVAAPQAAVAQATTAMMNESIELASKSIESVTKAVATAAKPAPKATIKASVKAKPVAAKPVVPDIKAVVKTADKLAEAMSEAPKPASRRRPARKA